MNSFLVVLLTLVALGSCAPQPKRYQCNQGVCVQQPYGSTQGSGLEVCRMVCGKGSIWPYPTGSVSISSTVVPIDMDTIQFSHSQPREVDALVSQATQFFLQTIKQQNKPSQSAASKQNFAASTLTVSTVIKNADTSLKLGIDESYNLNVTPGQGTVVATISANTFFGMRNGLETLSQLIVYDDTVGAVFTVNHADIIDEPKYTYRGVLLDTSRNYYTIEQIKKTIDALSFNKLNTFHWHVTDTGSFPLEIKAFPQMTDYGAYSPDKIYTQEQVKALSEYALARGVRLLPELDAPAHAGNGWQWGPGAGMGDLAFCVNQGPWESYCVEPPCGQLNPINDNLYKVLSGLYKEMVPMFNQQLFHMGGDEVFFGCWNSSQEIIDWLKDNNRQRDIAAFLDLWGTFQERAYQTLQSNKGTAIDSIPVMLWSSLLTNTEAFARKYLPPQNYIIEVWDSSDQMTVPNMLKQGYRIVVANFDAWYLDCGFGAWVGSGVNWCSPYKEWQLIYDNKPYSSSARKWNITDPTELALILGGETALWSEEADGYAFESRIWPRASAAAERLWTNPATSWSDANDRMQFHRARLVARGVNADALQPLWCLQNQGRCNWGSIHS